MKSLFRRRTKSSSQIKRQGTDSDRTSGNTRSSSSLQRIAEDRSFKESLRGSSKKSDGGFPASSPPFIKNQSNTSMLSSEATERQGLNPRSQSFDFDAASSTASHPQQQSSLPVEELKVQLARQEAASREGMLLMQRQIQMLQRQIEALNANLTQNLRPHHPPYPPPGGESGGGGGGGGGGGTPALPELAQLESRLSEKLLGQGALIAGPPLRAHTYSSTLGGSHPDSPPGDTLSLAPSSARGDGLGPGAYAGSSGPHHRLNLPYGVGGGGGGGGGPRSSSGAAGGGGGGGGGGADDLGAWLARLPPHLRLDADRLEVDEPVGEGSYGKVWRGTYRGLPVAVKIFHSEELDILAEVDMLHRVRDIPHVVKFLGIVVLAGSSSSAAAAAAHPGGGGGGHGGRAGPGVRSGGSSLGAPNVAVVTAFMPNGSLDDILVDSESPLYRRSPPATRLLHLAMQAAKGVRNLHRYNVIHRDLACRNFLLDDKLNVHVADFGFARLRGVVQSKGFSRSSVGPVKWEAPESLRDKEYSEKTDVFSFGTVLYEMWAQRPPWEGYHAANVCHQVLSGARLPLPLWMDPAVGRLVERAWAQRPEHRPSMQEVYDVLAARHHGLQNQARDAAWEVECVHRLMAGMTLLKVPYGKGGTPAERQFKVTADLRRLVWRPATMLRNHRPNPRRLRPKKEKVLPIALVKEVRVGRATPAFRRHAGHPGLGLGGGGGGGGGVGGAGAGAGVGAGAAAVGGRPAFSLITAHRTVDLVCDTPDVLNVWVTGLNFLIARYKRDTPPPCDLHGLAPPELSHEESSELGAAPPSRYNGHSGGGGGGGGGHGGGGGGGGGGWVGGPSNGGDAERAALHRGWTILAEMRRGWHLLKFGGNKRPHERCFRLSTDRRHLEWTTQLAADQGALAAILHKKQPKLKQLSLALVKEIRRTGGGSLHRRHYSLDLASNFSRTSRKKILNDEKYDQSLAFVLVGRRNKELLTLLAPNQGQFDFWTFGLQLVIQDLQKTLSEDEKDIGFSGFTNDVDEDNSDIDDLEDFSESPLPSRHNSARDMAAGGWRSSHGGGGGGGAAGLGGFAPDRVERSWGPSSLPTTPSKEPPGRRARRGSGTPAAAAAGGSGAEDGGGGRPGSGSGSGAPGSSGGPGSDAAAGGGGAAGPAEKGGGDDWSPGVELPRARRHLERQVSATYQSGDALGAMGSSYDMSEDMMGLGPPAEPPPPLTEAGPPPPPGIYPAAATAGGGGGGGGEEGARSPRLYSSAPHLPPPPAAAVPGGGGVLRSRGLSRDVQDEDENSSNASSTGLWIEQEQLRSEAAEKTAGGMHQGLNGDMQKQGRKNTNDADEPGNHLDEDLPDDSGGERLAAVTKSEVEQSNYFSASALLGVASPER